ncbi:MAG: hypothetical protein DLM70_11185 [Chloroflexi bacterium]|nr:MAG: hypothetical protein DLM70_11185 [Chloroflexota bacterium]
MHPAVVAPGGLLTLGVSTTGQVRAVQMSIGSGLPTAPPPIAYKLSLVSNGTWRGSGDAPSVPGEYHYSVALFAEDGRRLLRDNDAWNIQVGNTQPTVAPAAQSVPPELLAPPFFYGNPTPVVFSAAGRSVSGSEVVSNSRPDVAPATVAGYYSTHLPRAGWTVSGSQLPGSTSFTISASSGQRVCVIQYGASTIHVFFGVLGG